MTGKREQKRAALTTKLIDAAEAQMKTEGLKGMRARDIAQQAGCALGSVYTVFKDLDELALYVNLRTVARLDSVLEKARKDKKTPSDQLIALAKQYHLFAIENRHFWIALFDHHLYEERDLPQWYQAKHLDLFRHIELSLASLQPKLLAEEKKLQARALFSAVHGIISMNLQARFIAVPEDVLTEQLQDFIEIYIRGQAAS